MLKLYEITYGKNFKLYFMGIKFILLLGSDRRYDLVATPTFVFSALPPGSGGGGDSTMMQRKCVKNGGDSSADFAAFQMEDIDSSVQPSSILKSQMNYASTLKNPVDRYRQTMTEEFDFTDDDCIYSSVKHGQNVSFSSKVHNKLDFDWRCAVIVKLMGRPNSTNSFEFMLRGLRRKWQV
ncbi:hypothetical protein ACLB2K_011537 [Fragaria x ananassa]